MSQQGAMQKRRKTSFLAYMNRYKYLYILLVPCVIYYIIFHYIPMYGVVIAFKDFNFSRGILGSDWVGFEHFKYMFGLDTFYSVFINSLLLSLLRILFGFPAPILLALMINEFRGKIYKRTIQTIVYLPHFISWVVIGGIIINFLSPNWGFINRIIEQFGNEPIFFMAKSEYFRSIIVVSDIWKGAGWGTIIYLAAISGIPPDIYEAAIVDGASKIQRLWYITLPSLRPTIVTLFILRMGQIMSNGFEQIYVLQNPQNTSVSEVFETYTYKVGLISGRFSFSATVGLFTSVIGMILIFITDRLAKLFGEAGLY